MIDKKKRREDNRKIIRTYALGLQLGVTMLVCIFVSLFIGRFLAARIGKEGIIPFFIMLGALAGIRAWQKMIRRFLGTGGNRNKEESHEA